MAPKSISSTNSASSTTTTSKRIKNPLRLFKALSTKSKNKGKSQSTTSLSIRAQAPAPAVPELPSQKRAEGVKDEVVQNPGEVASKQEEQTRTPVEAEAQPAPAVELEAVKTPSSDTNEPEARDSQQAAISEPATESAPEKPTELVTNVARHSIQSTTPTVVEEQPTTDLVVVVDGEKLIVKNVPESEPIETEEGNKVAEARDKNAGPEASRPVELSESVVVVDAVPRDDDDLKLASSLTIVDLGASEVLKEAMDTLPADKDTEKTVTESAPVQLESHVPSQSPALEDATKPLVDSTDDINPFIVDDSDEPLSENEPESAPVKKDVPPAEETGARTDAPSLPAAPVPLPAPAKEAVTDHPLVTQSADSTVPVNVNKDVPPPPASTSPAPPAPASDTSSEEEAPELHTPALVAPTLFLPIPHIDPLTTLLIKHVPEPHLRPPRDLSGEWQQSDFHTLVISNNWRALARMARDRIVATSPSEVELILNLWYVRLSSLARLRLFNQTSAECENLFSALASIEPPSSRAYLFENILPFELEVMRARCSYWAGDHFGYLDDLSALLRRCKSKARKAKDPGEHSMWKERGARMCLIIASQLVEMKDYTAAAALLEPLCASGGSSPALHSAIARIYLQGGYIAMAARHFALADADPSADEQQKDTNALILSAANGDWPEAERRVKRLMERDPDNLVATSNCAVALLCLGKLQEAIQVLEGALQSSPSAVTTAEPYLFNLSTLYELRAGLTLRRKRDLLIEVAKWSGDGLRTTCLKMG